MIKINYPIYQPKIKANNATDYIFDEIRKQWILLTPEEWVRQNFIQYLIQVKQYPAALIAVEKEIKLGELKISFDIVVYNTNTQPWMLVECKEMKVALTELVLNQVLRYNSILQASYLVITNGIDCFAGKTEKNNLIELDSLPEFNT